MSNVLNIDIYQGATFKRVLTLTEATVPINLTGYSIAGQIRPGYNNSTLIASFDFTIRNQGTSPGVVDMSLDADVLIALDLKDDKVYFYDVEITSGSGEVTRIMQGEATVKPEVTK